MTLRVPHEGLEAGEDVAGPQEAEPHPHWPHQHHLHRSHLSSLLEASRSSGATPGDSTLRCSGLMTVVGFGLDLGWRCLPPTPPSP